MVWRASDSRKTHWGEGTIWFEDKAHAIAAHATAAFNDGGWALVHEHKTSSPPRLEAIANIGRDSRFRTDEEVWRHVWARAREGSETHKLALDLIREHNWPHYLEIVVHVAGEDQWPRTSGASDGKMRRGISRAHAIPVSGGCARRTTTCTSSPR
jgi:hypothetical protein